MFFSLDLDLVKRIDNTAWLLALALTDYFFLRWSGGRSSPGLKIFIANLQTDFLSFFLFPDTPS
jgi:hypothetical protein